LGTKWHGTLFAAYFLAPGDNKPAMNIQPLVARAHQQIEQGLWLTGIYMPFFADRATSNQRRPMWAELISWANQHAARAN
jgi:hypothetical protein